MASRTARPFLLDGWLTPNSYGQDYAPLPKGAGIYAFTYFVFDIDDIHEFILYVGMSTNIAQRVANHNLLPKLRSKHRFVAVYFFPLHRSSIREKEREFIRKFKPPYNIIGRIAGEA